MAGEYRRSVQECMVAAAANPRRRAGARMSRAFRSLLFFNSMGLSTGYGSGTSHIITSGAFTNDPFWTGGKQAQQGFLKPRG